MEIVGFALRRLLVAIPVLFVSTFLIFLAVAKSGDPLAELRERQPPVPPHTIAAEEARLGLDQPVLQRYWNWLTGVLQGDLGPSVDRNADIGMEIGSRLGITMRFVLIAMLIATVLAILVGVVSAVRQYSWLDYLFTSTGFLFLAMPSFWLAVLLKQGGIELNTLVGHTLIYTVGDSSVIPPPTLGGRIADLAGHLVLPTITLVLINFAAWSRFQRSSMLDVLGSDYVKLATAKGLRRRTVLRKYALRTALTPLVTVIALDFTAVFAGAVVTETVFQWRGMGDYLLESINGRDVNAVMAWLLVAAVAVVVFNLLADILYAALDPRIRRVR
ncbi:ABC transporter permease [Micromonospora sp. NBC_01638]|uniref:ABC transporter permease n=1 Tax=Micromonospora sp. NBC_01638 TaxID=2975982 RepID=UPI003867C217|nr:ABC transporter permease [Micromonospora sp. NBC_01638]